MQLFSPRIDSQLRGAVLLGRRSQSAVESISPHATARLHAPRPLPRCRGRPAGFGLEPTATSRPGALRLGGKPGKAARALWIDRQGCCFGVRRSPSLFGFGGGRGARRIVPGYLGLAFHERDGSLNRKGDQARRSCHRCRAMKGREIARVLISKHTALVHPECC